MTAKSYNNSVDSQSKPKILNVGFHLPPPGGAAIFIDNLERSNLNDRYELRGFDTDYPRWMKKTRILTFFYLPIMYLNFLLTLKRFHPDIVHVHTPSMMPFFKHTFFAKLSRICGIQVVSQIHGGSIDFYYSSLNRFWQKRFRMELSQSSLLVVLSKKWRNIFRKIYPEDKIRVIENGIPLENYPFRKNFSSQSGKELLFVGRLIDSKGVNELLDAIAAIVKIHPDIHLTIAGGEPVPRWNKLECYRSKCEILDISENVTFAGEVPAERLIKFYENADIFVLPSHAEGMPLVLLEAMATGLACIATNVGAIPEVLNSTNIPGGIIIPAEDKDALERALLELAGNKDRIEEMGRENRRIIESRFSFDNVAENMHNVYNELIIMAKQVG